MYSLARGQLLSEPKSIGSWVRKDERSSVTAGEEEMGSVITGNRIPLAGSSSKEARQMLSPLPKALLLLASPERNFNWPLVVFPQRFAVCGCAVLHGVQRHRIASFQLLGVGGVGFPAAFPSERTN